ncbi:MAG: hypothetical protein LBN39_01340 [Planctomycetaceae bacterium]|jgi:hypothetical protein|nr:hypothetical protein [Planctomycetaceae bacterium]
MKTIFKLFLIGSLLLPFAVTGGCASWKSGGAKNDSIFTLPKKKPAKPKKPKKDPGVPMTVGEFLQMERNDVL